MKTFFFLFLFSFSFSCVSTTEPIPLYGQPLVGDILSTFRIEAQKELLGYLVQIEFDTKNLGRRYVVQNAFHQQVGFIDANGKAYRYRVTDGEVEYVRTGVTEENLQAIFKTSSPISLVQES